MTVKKTLMLSIASGVLAIILSALYLHIKEVEVAGGGVRREVLVAAADIGPNTIIEPGLIRVKKIPRAYIQPNVLTETGEIFGKVSIAKIGKGEQILGTKLVMGGPKSGLSVKVPSGKRAVSIQLSDADCAGGLIQPDDYVDIIITFDFGDDDRSDKYTYTLFQNVTILAVDSKLHSLRSPEGIAVVEKKGNDFFGSSSAVSRSGGKGKTVTFALDPDEAKKLIFATESGEITLALRSPMDRAEQDDEHAVNVESLTGKAGFIRKGYKEYRGK